MTGSLQIKKNKYYVVVNIKDENGKPKLKWLATGLDTGTGKRRLEEAKKKILAEFEEEYNRKLYSVKPDFTPYTRYTFVEFLDMWLKAKKQNVARNTYKGYAKNCRRIKGYFESMNLMLDELKPIHIQEFYNKMYQEGLSGNTICHFHTNIKSALKYAVRNELIASNPADMVDRPKIEKYVANFYNKDELEELFEIFNGDRMELCVHIGAYYGLRRGEIVGLKWDAIDFENKTITIKHTISNEYGSGKEVIIAENKVKTKSSYRTLPLIQHIEELLLEEKKNQESYAALLKSGYDQTYEGYICRDKLGKLITPDYVSNHFKYVIKKYNLKKIRFHDLRHSCATLLLQKGISMKQIQEWLGHSSYNTTANIYSHLEFNAKKEAADAISKAFE